MSELVKALRDAYEETDTVYFHLRTIINDAADTIDRLTAELTEYRSLAAEYGIDGQTMLALAKSQIATVRENAPELIEAALQVKEVMQS